jgi:cell division protein FtsQ
MAEKRKISVRKILQLLLSITGAVGCIIAMVSASGIEGEKTLKKLPVVQIKNDRKYHSIEQKKIMDLAIYNRNIDILHTPVSRLDVRGIEQAIKSDPWVENAQVFVDIDRVMHIQVTRRVPVARIFRTDGESYYLDSTLHTMPLSDDYTYYANVVTNVPYLGNDSAAMVVKKNIATVVKAINADSFWNAQVSQISMDSAGMFEFTTVIGDQKVILGDTSRLQEKFTNLLAFYRNVLNRIGWDKYQVLDARFVGQVVASPSLPFKGPIDRAVDKMNWITSIEVTEAQKSHEDSIRTAEARFAAIATAKAESLERAKKKAAALAAAAAAEKAAHTKHGGVSKALRESVATGKAAKKAAAANADRNKKVIKPAAKVPTKETVAADKKKQPTKAIKATAAKPGKTTPSKQQQTVAKKAVPASAKAVPAAKATAKKAPPKKLDKKNVKTKAAVKDKKKDKKEKTKTKESGKYLYPSGKQH